MRAISNLLYHRTANQSREKELYKDFNKNLSEITSDSGIEAQVDAINKEISRANDCITSTNEAIDDINGIISEIEDAGVYVPKSIKNLNTNSEISELSIGSINTKEIEENFSLLSSVLSSSISVVEEIAIEFWEYIVEQEEINYNDMIDGAKELAKSIGFPEEQLVEKQKVIHLKNLEAKNLSIDELSMISELFSRNLDNLMQSSNYPQEIKKILFTQFYESYFTDMALNTEEKSSEEKNRFYSLTRCITSLDIPHAKGIQQLLIDTFKDNKALHLFVIGNFNLKEIEENTLLKAASDQILMASEISTTYCTNLLTEKLGSDSLMHRVSSSDSHTYTKYRDNHIVNSITYMIENRIQINMEDERLLKNIKEFPHKNRKNTSNTKVYDDVYHQLLKIEDKLFSFNHKIRLENHFKSLPDKEKSDELNNIPITFKM